MKMANNRRKEKKKSEIFTINWLMFRNFSICTNGSNASGSNLRIRNFGANLYVICSVPVMNGTAFWVELYNNNDYIQTIFSGSVTNPQTLDVAVLNSVTYIVWDSNIATVPASNASFTSSLAGMQALVPYSENPSQLLGASGNFFIKNWDNFE